MITFSSVSKQYEDGTKAVHSLDFTIEKGELFVLIGPSGCGKTTTMKMINRLIEPTQGTITIGGRDIRTYNVQELRWNIGYVLQQIALFPHMTIAENIAIVPEMKGWKKKQTDERINELLDMVGLAPGIYRERKPAELSGGQQQRVGVVRALAGDPEIILMDEPFSALDPISREQLQQDIQKLQLDIKKTIVFVTHDIDEAMALGDRVCLMRAGEIVQLDIPQNLILHPANPFVQDFIGDRKTPWLTAVDVLCDPHSPHLVSWSAFKQNQIPAVSPLFAEDEEGKLAGEWIGGELVHNPPVLQNDMRLHDALSIMEKYNKDALPVIKHGKIQGVLSYKNIVAYLASKNRQEVGTR